MSFEVKNNFLKLILYNVAHLQQKRLSNNSPNQESGHANHQLIALRRGWNNLAFGIPKETTYNSDPLSWYFYPQQFLIHSRSQNIQPILSIRTRLVAFYFILIKRKIALPIIDKAKR